MEPRKRSELRGDRSRATVLKNAVDSMVPAFVIRTKYRQGASVRRSHGWAQVGTIFADFDHERFWAPSDYALQEYVGPPVTEKLVTDVERELGCRLPASYVELMRSQNGGIPRRRSHRTREGTSWSKDHIAIQGLYSIGGDKRCSLCGECGSRFWIAEWGYPEIGVYFADCPSAGHDMLCLDYRSCGPSGEPAVVHVDQEWDYRIVTVAETFEAFVRGLEDDSAFDIDA